MRFPRYPEYKESGVEWLGEVPSHWNLFHLKRDLTFLTSGSRGWADHYSSDGALFIRIGNLTRDSIKLDLADVQRVAVPDGTEGERTKVQAGDLLFSITAFLGSVAVAPPGLEPSYVSQHVALARLRQNLFNPFWVGYVALSHIGKTYLGMQGYGGTKIQLSLNDVAEIPIPTPPYDDQSAIAAFLDWETAKIDALIAECLASDWSLERMPRVDRCLARIAIWEMQSGTSSAEVAVQQAVQLAQELSTDGSANFLNGLLAKVKQRLEGDEN